MPIAGLIQGFAENRLSAGLSAREAAEIHELAMTEVEATRGRMRGARLARAKEQLVRITELYGRFFTDAGAREWKELTGIDIGTGRRRTVYPKGFMPAQKIVSLRKAMAEQDKRLRERYDVSRVGKGVRVDNAGLDLAELERRTPRDPRPARLSVKQALTLHAPRTLLNKTLQQPDCRTVAALSTRFREWAREHGSKATSIAERDLDGAPDDLVALMEQIWEVTGNKRLTLKQIEERLPDAVEAFYFRSKRYARRLEPRYQALYAQLSTEAVDFMVSEYQGRVVRRGEPPALVLQDFGFGPQKHRVRIQPYLDRLLPPPTLDEIEYLHGLALDGEIDALDFYKATGLSKYDLFQLCAAMPDRFELQLNEGSAFTPLGQNRQKQDRLSEEEIAALFNQKVVREGMSVKAFCEETGVRYSRLKFLRRTTDLFDALNPVRQVPDAQAEHTALVSDLIAVIDRIFARDVLQTVPEVIARIDGEKDFHDKWGRMDWQRYLTIRNASDGAFPDYRPRARWAPTLRREYLDLVNTIPDLTNKRAVAELKELHPNITRGRLRQLFTEYPNLPRPWIGKRRTNAESRKLARRVANMLRKQPMTLEEISKALRAKGVDCPVSGVSSLVHNYRDEYFSDVRPVSRIHRFEKERHSLIGRSLLQLAIRCAPPDADREEIGRVWGLLLGRAGLPTELPKTAVKRMHDYTGRPGEVKLDTHRAKVYAEIVAEFARAAETTDGADEIIARVLEKYPIDPKRFGQLRKRWVKNPGDYPALAPFMQERKLALRGRGENVAEPRFLDGWDPKRALLSRDPEAVRELAYLSQAVRVPLVQPELDAMVDDLLGGSRPLQAENVVWVTHALGDNLPVARVLKKAGASGPQTIVVATPYGSTPMVNEALGQIGFQVTQAPLDEQGFLDAVEAGLDRAIELHKKNGRPINVMDDGGLISTVMANEPEKYAPWANAIRVTELTTQGIILAEKTPISHLVISVARSALKALTDRASAKSIAGKIVQKLLRAGDDPHGKKLMLYGYGHMGTWIARFLSDAGVDVTVVETNTSQVERAGADYDTILANADGSITAEEKKALQRADYVVGITGGTSMNLERFRLLKDNAHWASAASKRREGEMDRLTEASSSKEVLPEDNPLIQSRTAVYELDGKKIFVDGDGWPINFDGGIEISDPVVIQFMHMAMLAGMLVQGSNAQRRSGLEKLRTDLDEYVIDKLVPYIDSRTAEVYDPDRWFEDIEKVTALYATRPHMG